VHAAHGGRLVVVLVIDEDGVLTVQGEGQAPVAAHQHGLVSRQIGGERMQLPTGQVHVLGQRRNVKPCQLPPELGGVSGLDPCLRSGFEKALEPLALELLDHARECIATLYSLQAYPRPEIREIRCREIR